MFATIQNKPKYKKITIDPYEFGGEVGTELYPGIRPDNQWLLYNSKTLPKTESEWDRPRYVHNQYTGFYAWPKQLEIFAAASEQATAAKRMNALTDQEQEIFNFFSNPTNVDTLIKYFSMEERKGKDIFNAYRFLLFKVLKKSPTTHSP